MVFATSLPPHHLASYHHRHHSSSHPVISKGSATSLPHHHLPSYHHRVIIHHRTRSSQKVYQFCITPSTAIVTISLGHLLQRQCYITPFLICHHHRHHSSSHPVISKGISVLHHSLCHDHHCTRRSSLKAVLHHSLLICHHHRHLFIIAPQSSRKVYQFCITPSAAMIIAAIIGHLLQR